MKKLILTLLLFILLTSAYCKNLTVAVLNVGQGLCCVVISPDNHCMVFDCGTMDSKKFATNRNVFNNVLKPYLAENNIKAIDYLSLSHPNTDHYSGFPDLVKAYKIKKYLKNGFKADNYTYNNLQKELKKKNLSATVARGGLNFSLGPSVNVLVLAPLDNRETKNDNDQSLMMKLTYKNTSFLLSGDATAYEERLVAARWKKQLSSDVLLVAHHGSKYSSCNEFLRYVKPQAAIISCGKNNKFGHPHAQTLDRLKNFKAKIYRTDKQNSIICSSDGQKITIKPVGNKKSLTNKYKL